MELLHTTLETGTTGITVITLMEITLTEITPTEITLTEITLTEIILPGTTPTDMETTPIMNKAKLKRTARICKDSLELLRLNQFNFKIAKQSFSFLFEIRMDSSVCFIIEPMLPWYLGSPIFEYRI